MASNYEQFYLNIIDEFGVIETLAGVDVIIYDVDTASDIDTVTSDSNGLIAAGSVSVDPGSRIRFRVENYNGLAASITQETT